jgi:hypothetical protein
VDLESGAIRKLTTDAFADLQPSWAPDGRRLVYATDRFSSSLESLQFGEYELAIMDVASARSSRLPTFEGTRHNSPQWSRDGAIYFIAYPDGVPDVYRVEGEGGSPARVTRLITGATAITATSPALSVAADGSRLAVVVYRDMTYEIQAVEGERLRGLEPAPTRTTLNAGQLAPATRRDAEVDQILSSPRFGLPVAAPQAVEDYDPDLSLDYVGQEFGVTTFNTFGGYVGGGIAFSFSDMLGDHTVSSLLQINGGFEDSADRSAISIARAGGTGAASSNRFPTSREACWAASTPSTDKRSSSNNSCAIVNSIAASWGWRNIHSAAHSGSNSVRRYVTCRSNAISTREDFRSPPGSCCSRTTRSSNSARR